MKKNKRNEALKQGMQPAAQALSDDDLMNVTGGTIYWRSRTRRSGETWKEYGVFYDGDIHWGYAEREAEYFATLRGQSTHAVQIDC